MTTIEWTDETWPLPNVWLGVSAEDQKTFNQRVPLLEHCPAAVRFLSLEPLLGMIDVGLDVTCDLDYALGLKPRPDFKNSPRRADLIHWVICGAESGHGARPMEEDWASFALAQCREAGVPFFMKQLCDARGRKIPFAQWPKDLKVREWPKAVTDVAAW